MKDETNTLQPLQRTANDNQSTSGSNEHKARLWRAAFNAQCTPDMMDDVTAYATKHASWIDNRTGRHDPDRVEDLVHDALTDTFAGTVAWEPSRCSLALHLKSVIRSRVTHELERAEQFEHIDVGTAHEEDVSSSMAATARSTTGSELDRFADEFERRLRELAAGDDGALVLIDLYREGVTEKREVCLRAKMKAADYHNAHRRLKRLVEKLPENLRTAAIAEMA
jgi:hypothetical protein